MDSTPAVLLRKSRFSDTSLVVTWLTLAYGRVRTLAKGALQPKSRFAGVLDLFHTCDVILQRSTRSDLHLLKECSLAPDHRGIRRDYATLSLAAYFGELLELATELDHAVPELFDLLQRAVGFLATKTPTQRALVHFEEELVRLLGINHPGATAILSIGRAYHRIPSTRANTLKVLPA